MKAKLDGLGTAAQNDTGDFASAAAGLPTGGTTGQIPYKLSGDDYDVGFSSLCTIDEAGGVFAVDGRIRSVFDATHYVGIEYAAQGAGLYSTHNFNFYTAGRAAAEIPDVTFSATSSAIKTRWSRYYGVEDYAYLDLYNPATGYINLWNTRNYPIVFGTNNLEQMRILSSGKVGVGTVLPTAQQHIVSQLAATVGQTIKGAVSQSANLFELTDSNDVVKTSFDVTGKATVDSLNTSKTIIIPGTTGNQTINKSSGRVNIAAAGTTITVTNSLVDANSIIRAEIATNDATAKILNVVAAAGTFTINIEAATAETAINFFITN